MVLQVYGSGADLFSYHFVSSVWQLSNGEARMYKQMGQGNDRNGGSKALEAACLIHDLFFATASGMLSATYRLSSRASLCLSPSPQCHRRKQFTQRLLKWNT